MFTHDLVDQRSHELGLRTSHDELSRATVVLGQGAGLRRRPAAHDHARARAARNAARDARTDARAIHP